MYLSHDHEPLLDWSQESDANRELTSRVRTYFLYAHMIQLHNPSSENTKGIEKEEKHR